METLALNVITKKNELSVIVKEKGRDNIQAKLVNEEIEETSVALKEMK
jgi:hypothetical protein